MKKEIIIASTNKGKIKELQEILTQYTIIPQNEIQIKTEVNEDQETFEENAIQKAKQISKELQGKACIADDSGIQIDYLNGFPGVYTKRWYEGTDRQRNLEILEKLKNVPKEKRRVKCVTAIAIAKGDKVIVETGMIEGYISTEIRGNNGFGFDEIFELMDGNTLAELSTQKKNEISSRRKAIEKIKKRLEQFDEF